MIAPMARITFAAFALLTAAWPATVHAQDVPGIEICTVEKTMERRTSCLQSNVDFLQKTINKLTTDHQQKFDAANRQIEALKGAVVGLQKLVSDCRRRRTRRRKTRRRPQRLPRRMPRLRQRMLRRLRKARSSGHPAVTTRGIAP